MPVSSLKQDIGAYRVVYWTDLVFLTEIFSSQFSSSSPYVYTNPRQDPT